MSVRSAVRRRVLLLILMSIGIAHSVVGADDTDTRKAWLYTDRFGERAYAEVAEGKWVATHPEQPPANLDEVDRNADHIVIQNVASRLIIRLTPGRAYWRRPSDTDWTTYVKGDWGDLPDEIRRSLPKPSAAVGLRKPEDYVVRAAYFVPSDRQPVDGWEEKIRVILFYVESMFRNDLKLKRLESDGIRFERENGEIRIHLIRGVRPADYYNDSPRYDANKQFAFLAPEIADVIGAKTDCVGLVFAQTYDEGPADELWNGRIALGGYYSANGGLGIFSAHLLRDEFCARTIEEQPARFFDQTPVPGRRALGHPPNSPRCEFVEDGFGAVIHEMGHALGLPHDMRDQDRFVMSNGFRNIRRNLSPRTPRSQLVTFSDWNTNLLMSSRYVNPKLDLTDNDAPKADLKVLGIVRGQLQAELTATDSNGLRAWAVSDKGSDSMIAGGALTSNELSRRILLPAKPEAGKVSLTFIVADNGGNQTRVRETFAP